nr:hypothetical protein [uncultured Cohaesibacter sp.]
MTISDPFFSIPDDPEWNACIGRQSDEENYADGFIEAAIELSEAILTKRMYEKRDTLVLPILYTARHAIELNLKLVIGELVRAGVISNEHDKDHNISSHLRFLEDHSIPDELLRTLLTTLRPFVDSLAKIDKDGQELRFYENRDGERSMKELALANIVVINASLIELQDLLKKMKFRSYSLGAEWSTGTRTGKCSRRDLIEIAKLLPNRNDWSSNSFKESKIEICKRFDLGSRQFSLALNKIETTRGLSCLIGIESHLVHLSDQKAILLLKRWSSLHPPRDPKDDIGLDYFKRDWDMVKRDSEARSEVYNTIMAEFSEDEFADAETIFYIGRDHLFSERYETILESKKAKFKARSDFYQEIDDLMSKTNFRSCFIQGLQKVGCLSLSKRLQIDL